ncbi:hypothetical protein CR513_22686, partial [Mucuna pruriens]
MGTNDQNLRTISLQEGEDDVSPPKDDKKPKRGSMDLQGSMTRERMKRLQEEIETLLILKEKKES